jgi:hypothetical protein
MNRYEIAIGKKPAVKPKSKEKYRIVTAIYKNDPISEKRYFLQIKGKFGWGYACGYHRGAPGQYNYEIDHTYNPFALVEYTIPDIENEIKQPTLSIANICLARCKSITLSLKPRNPKIVYTDIRNISEAIKKHRETNLYSYPDLEAINE